jgi:hypothetical protein
MAAPCVGAAALLTLQQVHRTRAAIVQLIVAGFLGAVLIAWVSLPIVFLHRLLQFERPVELVQLLSAVPSDYLSRPGHAIVPFPAKEPLERDTAGLFPGLLMLILAATALPLCVRRNPFRLWCAFSAAMVAVAFVLSLGLNFSIGNWRPFETLREFAPGFAQLRSPFRYAAFVQLGLCLLAVASLHRIGERGLGRISGKAAILALGILACLENLALPVTLVPVPAPPRTEWTQWLRAKPASTIVAHLPFASGPHVSHYEVDAWHLYAQIDHQKRMVNGYSGFFPPGYLRFQLDMAREFPSLPLLCLLSDRLGVNTLVLDRNWLDEHAEALKVFHTGLALLYHDDHVSIFNLAPPASGCPASVNQSPTS